MQRVEFVPKEELACRVGSETSVQILCLDGLSCAREIGDDGDRLLCVFFENVKVRGPVFGEEGTSEGSMLLGASIESQTVSLN